MGFEFRTDIYIHSSHIYFGRTRFIHISWNTLLSTSLSLLNDLPHPGHEDPGSSSCPPSTCSARAWWYGAFNQTKSLTINLKNVNFTVKYFVYLFFTKLSILLKYTQNCELYNTDRSLFREKDNKLILIWEYLCIQTLINWFLLNFIRNVGVPDHEKPGSWCRRSKAHN
jgi:hypothetical protein